MSKTHPIKIRLAGSIHEMTIEEAERDIARLQELVRRAKQREQRCGYYRCVLKTGHDGGHEAGEETAK